MIPGDIASMYRHERCQHRTPSGRRCSATVTDARYAYCPNHVPSQPHDAEDLSGPLTENAGQFLNAQGINYSLAALYHLLASGKISSRRAGTLAYISSLLLHSLNSIDNDRHPTAGFEEKPDKVYASEAQWALAKMTPPIVPPPTATRIQDPQLADQQQRPIDAIPGSNIVQQLEPSQTSAAVPANSSRAIAKAAASHSASSNAAIARAATAEPSQCATRLVRPKAMKREHHNSPCDADSQSFRARQSTEPLPPGLSPLPKTRGEFANEVRKRVGLPCSP